MTVYEILRQHSADYAQGVVVLGVVVAVYVGWKVLSGAVEWVADDAARAAWTADLCQREVEALKTRVKALEGAAARAAQRSAEKQKVRIAKVVA